MERFLCLSLIGTLLVAPTLSHAAPVRARHPVRSFTGTYEAGHLGTLEVQALPGGRIRFHLDVTGNHGGMSPHVGEAGGVLSLRNGVAVYVPGDAPKGNGARLTLRFQGRRVRITQTGSSLDVGFGEGVYANGTYVKTSDRVPEFDPADLH